MAVGLAAALAGAWLNTLRSVAFTTIPGAFIKLHTNAGDPGSAGTANASANTTRVAATFGAATGTGPVSISLSNTPTWASWAAGAETIAHVSDWDTVGPAGGTFEFSASLTTPKSVANGDTLTLTSLSVSLSPIAA